MESSDFHLKRPALLNKILNAVNMRDNMDREVYVNFLTSAKESMNNPKGLAIKFAYNNGEKPDVPIRNSSLCHMFFFYTKVQSTFQKVGKSASYEEEENARVSLSFYELLLLCRDFRIIPKIITKEELYYLWRVMNVQKGKEGKQVSRLVSFADFKDFLARIAILAFNKPGIRQMIMQDGGNMPQSTELIGMLAKYLHLDDIEWVKNRIRTVGKATVSMINSRCAGELNLLTKNTLREDLKGTRLAKILSVERNEECIPCNKNTARGKIRPSSTGAVPNRKSKYSASNGINKEPGRPSSRMATKISQAKAQAMELEQKSTLSPFEEKVYTLLKNIEDIEDVDREDEYDTNALHEFSVDSVEESFSQENMDETTGISQGKLFVSKLQQDLLEEYHSSLAMTLDPFSDLGAYAKNRNQNFSNFDRTEVEAQNFLDLGSLVMGKKCVIRLTIVNDTPYEINVSSTVEGQLSTEPLKITTMPNSFCPGLSHSVYISFVASETVKNISCTFAKVITKCTSPTHPSFGVMNCCPIFYRAVRPDVSTSKTNRNLQYPLCTPPLLDYLLEKFDFKNALIAEYELLKYNPSSHAFTFPQQEDFTHSRKQSSSEVDGTNIFPQTSLHEIAPESVPAIARKSNDTKPHSPVVISRSPTINTLRPQFSRHGEAI